MLDVAAPRFVKARGPHYESFYVRAWDPAVPRAAWIRYTTSRAPGAPATGSLWVTAFEPHGVVALRADGLQPAAGANDRWIDIGGARIWEDPDRAIHLAGEAASGAHAARWALTLQPRTAPWLHLAPSWLYGAPLPRTKSTSPVVAARARGTLTIDGVERTYTAGMLGHNWGSEHAHRWIWIHGADAAGNAVDLVGGRLKVGGRVLPWKLSGLVQLDGVRTRVGGLFARATVDANAQRCIFAVSKIRGEAIAGPRALWSYDDPSGGAHDVTNSSIATVRLQARGRAITFAAAAYEFGTDAGALGATPAEGAPSGDAPSGGAPSGGAPLA